MPSELKGKEWYAFVLVELPQEKMFEKFYIEISTFATLAKEESKIKVRCAARGEHLTDCFIGYDQVDP